MIRGVRLRRFARRELEEIADFLADRNEAAALRFGAAVEDSLRRIAETPGIGHPWTAGDTLLRGVRTWPLSGYESILIFYRPSPRGIEVMRIVHGARSLPAILEEE